MAKVRLTDDGFRDRDGTCAGFAEAIHEQIEDQGLDDKVYALIDEVVDRNGLSRGQVSKLLQCLCKRLENSWYVSLIDNNGL